MTDERLMDSVLLATSARWSRLNFWRKFKPDGEGLKLTHKARKEREHDLWVSVLKGYYELLTKEIDMEGTLYWRSCSGKPLHDELRACLAKSTHIWKEGEDRIKIVEHNEIDYFRGLADAGVQGAEEIIAAIKDSGTIEIWIVGG